MQVKRLFPKTESCCHHILTKCPIVSIKYIHRFGRLSSQRSQIETGFSTTVNYSEECYFCIFRLELLSTIDKKKATAPKPSNHC